MDTAVLLLVFNRPEPTATVMAAIRRAAPRRLYVAGDGPRRDRSGEMERVIATRAIATTIDWDCELVTLFRDVNLGCKRAISGALEWFFSNEPEGIVLEDDIVPDDSFFPFCVELLERYRDHEEVGIISGFNPVPTADLTPDSYLFSSYAGIWGWASWARAWRGYQVDMQSWSDPDAAKRLADVLDGRQPAIDYWRANFDAVARGDIDTWDYQLAWHGWRHGRGAILPVRNLCDNIGFGADATHTTGPKSNRLLRLGLKSLAFPLRHPARIAIDKRFDRRLERLWYALGPWQRARRALARVLRIFIRRRG